MKEQGVSRVTGSISVGRDLSGQVAVGNAIRQDMSITGGERPSEEELAELRAAVEQLRQSILGQVPAELEPSARERVDELAEAVFADAPDLSALEHLQKWFRRRVPQVASAFTSLVFHPVLAKLVAAGGDGLVLEFRRRFGG